MTHAVGACRAILIFIRSAKVQQRPLNGPEVGLHLLRQHFILMWKAHVYFL